MTRRASIGFDRRIDIEWLDAAAAHAASDASGEEIREYLWKLLDGAVSGDKSNSARGKTVTVLNHIWGEVPQVAAGLRGRAAARLEAATPDERLALHWAMMVGTYPVFTDVAAAGGRLMTLQGSFSLAQLTRRLVGHWGERSTVIRAAQRIVRSMIQWGVLRDTNTRGVYESLGQVSVGIAAGVLLFEGLLIDADDAGVSFDQLMSHAALFPFRLNASIADLRSETQFEVHRQGLDVDVVQLRPHSSSLAEKASTQRQTSAQCPKCV